MGFKKWIKKRIERKAKKNLRKILSIVVREKVTAILQWLYRLVGIAKRRNEHT